MVGGGATGPGGLEDQVELGADLLLPDELAQFLGAQGGLDGGVLAVGDGAHQPVAVLVGAVGAGSVSYGFTALASDLPGVLAGRMRGGPVAAGVSGRG